MPNFILSPCGTSLLTNQANGTERSLVFKYANVKNYQDIPPDDLQQLENLNQRVAVSIATADDLELVSKMSAELNCIIKLYDGRITKNRDHHVLLCTDTWLGETTAKFIEAWLVGKGFSVEVKRQQDLQVQDINAFQLALSDIVLWCESTIPGYKKDGYHVIFNLTGGFKSVQGFLQTLATFYADETIYIFETAKDLLRIPRLPVEMRADKAVRENLEIFRRLSSGLATIDIGNIPETLLMKFDNRVILSAWGDLVWTQTKKIIYQEQLYRSPSSKLVFGEKFEQSVRGISADRFGSINERIDQLARCLETNGEYNPPSLDFKQLKGHPCPPSTHEIDAWSDRGAQRIFGHYDGDIFVLDRLDKHL